MKREVVMFKSLALPCTVRLVPVQRRSPPEPAVAPVSKFSAVLADSVVVWSVISAIAAIGKSRARTAIEERVHTFDIFVPPENAILDHTRR
jgi:hypothetical protein